MSVAVATSYDILDFFPDCCLPDCPDKDNGAHQHILPNQQPILDSTAKYLYMQGGVGGGKTTAFAVKAVWLSLTIPRNRGVVSRYHFAQLYDSTWREVKGVLQRLVDKDIIPEPEYTKKQFGDYTQIVLHNGSEIQAIHSKNMHQALGASHGWFLVDDGMECLEEFFIGNQEGTTAGLLSRLRLPHIHFDPNTYDSVSREHGSLHGMVASNPPPYGHWLHKLFGDKPGMHRIGDDSVEWLQGTTGDNPFTGEGYGRGLIAVQRRMGRPEAVVRRVIFGESIPAYKGVPVYPQFDHKRHVAPLKFHEELPLITAWDFGEQHPAIVYSNLYRCKAGNHHYFTLSEVADQFNCTVYVLKKEHDRHMAAFYGNARLVRNCGDRAGYRNSSSNKDGRSDMKILIQEFHMPFKWKFLNLQPSLQYMRGRLEPAKACPCGLEYILISPKCKTLIGALEGGYYYPKPRGANGHSDKPAEDRLFADVACAWRYGDENYGKWGVDARTGQGQRRDLVRHRGDRFSGPLSFLEASDADFAQKLLN